MRTMYMFGPMTIWLDILVCRVLITSSLPHASKIDLSYKPRKEFLISITETPMPTILMSDVPSRNITISISPSKVTSIKPSSKPSATPSLFSTLAPSILPTTLPSSVAEPSPLPSSSPPSIVNDEIQSSTNLGGILGQTRKELSSFTVAEGVAILLAFTVIVAVTGMFISLCKKSTNSVAAQNSFPVDNGILDDSINETHESEKNGSEKNEPTPSYLSSILSQFSGSLISQCTGSLTQTTPSMRSQNSASGYNDIALGYEGSETSSKIVVVKPNNSPSHSSKNEDTLDYFIGDRHQINWQGEVIPDPYTMQYSDSDSDPLEYERGPGMMDSLCCSAPSMPV